MSPVITFGFGPGSSIAGVVTLGFAVGGVTPPTTVQPGYHHVTVVPAFYHTVTVEAASE